MTQPPPRPNVVVFLTDQQRWDTMSAHGNPLDLTPNLDRLAEAGTHMTHAFTPQPVCTPSRAVLQSGQYPTSTGVFRNGIALPPDTVTIARAFAAAGYDTGYIGKWHLAATVHEPVPEERRGGYQYWLAGDVVELNSGPYSAHLQDSDGETVRLPGYRADAYVDAAIRYLSTDHDRPFLLFISLLEPHHQNAEDDYLAPHGYRERYADGWVPGDLAGLGGSSKEHLGGYWGAVKRVDEAFGRLLDALDSLDLRSDTIVAFTSDHGCHFKTRNDEYKRSAHDASIRVPLVLDGPGFHGGGARDELVSLIDLPPTLLAAAGLPIPPQMQGCSFYPASVTDLPSDVFIQISESQVGRALRTPRWKYSVSAPGVDAWVESAASRYVDDLLYDLESDPHEVTNLVGSPDHRDIRNHLQERLVDRMIQAGESPPQIDLQNSDVEEPRGA